HATNHTAVDPLLRFISSDNHPIIHWPVPFLELPAEQPLIEREGPFGVLRMNLEVNDARHGLLLKKGSQSRSLPLCQHRLERQHDRKVNDEIDDPNQNNQD